MRMIILVATARVIVTAVAALTRIGHAMVGADSLASAMQAVATRTRPLVPLHSDYDRLSVGGTVRSCRANPIWSLPQHVVVADPGRELTSPGLVASRPSKRHRLFNDMCNGATWATGQNLCAEVLVPAPIGAGSLVDVGNGGVRSVSRGQHWVSGMLSAMQAVATHSRLLLRA